jgi:hypothetical protein
VLICGVVGPVRLVAAAALMNRSCPLVTAQRMVIWPVSGPFDLAG